MSDSTFKGDPNDATLSPQEVMEDIVEGVQDTHPDALDTDIGGQLVIRTNIWRWKDGTYHTSQSMHAWLHHLHLSPFCYRTYPGISDSMGHDACPCGWVEAAPEPNDYSYPSHQPTQSYTLGELIRQRMTKEEREENGYEDDGESPILVRTYHDAIQRSKKGDDR